MEPQSYHFVAVSGSQDFYLQELLLDGGAWEYGPFMLGQAFGADLTVDSRPDNHAERLYLPLVSAYGDDLSAAAANDAIIYTKYY